MKVNRELETVRNIFTEYMKKSGLRKTPERYAVLDEIYMMDGHFNVDMLFTRLQKRKIRVSRATVYNTIEHLLNCDLVTKHHLGKPLYV